MTSAAPSLEPTPPGGDGDARARRRRHLALLVGICAACSVVLTDLLRRFSVVRSFDANDALFYWGSALVSVAFWGSLAVTATSESRATRWLARSVLVAAALLTVGAQSYTYSRYQSYLDHRAVLVGTSMLPSVGQQLWFDRSVFALTVLPPVLVALFIPLLITKVHAPKSRSVGFAADMTLVALLIAFFVSPTRGAEQGTTPDVMYLNAMGQLSRAKWYKNQDVTRVHPGPRTPRPVPSLTPKAKRNVLMIVTESVRAQEVCVAYDAEGGCSFTPFSNAAAPRRFPVTQMRALDSTTAISLAVMWNGLLPTESREDLHSAPLLWEYAHAAGYDGAYWTSQHLLFANSGVWLEGIPASKRISATQVEPDASYEVGADDGKLIDHVLGELDGLKEPYFGVVHLSNTHYPYKIDDDDCPFVRESETQKRGDDDWVLSRYRDAVRLQDKAVGRFITEFRKRPDSKRTAIVFVSDHGEQLREKGLTGHTFTLFDQEIRIPFWIDAPEGLLTASEEAHLKEAKNVPVTSLEVMPTVMDLLGVWDAPNVAPFRAKIAGTSLLQGLPAADRTIVMTNCTELWACAYKNWGAMQGTKKLFGSSNHRGWSCFDVANDPKEEHDLGEEPCRSLVHAVDQTLHGTPF